MGAVDEDQPMIDKLVFKGSIPDTMHVAEYNHNHGIHKMDHLSGVFRGGHAGVAVTGAWLRRTPERRKKEKEKKTRTHTYALNNALIRLSNEWTR